MKKLTLGIGALSAAAVPIAAVVSCGDKDNGLADAKARVKETIADDQFLTMAKKDALNNKVDNARTFADLKNVLNLEEIPPLLSTEQDRVNDLRPIMATVTKADAPSSSPAAFDSNAQRKYGLLLGSPDLNKFAYTYIATSTTITVKVTLKNHSNLVAYNPPRAHNIVFNKLNGAASIGEDAFRWATLPAGFTIPSSVTSIGQHAFEEATLPEGFSIPSSVRSIGGGAFKRATLPVGFVIPPTVTWMGEGVFYGTTLPAGFTLPLGITSIEETAFYGATLPDGFTIPSSVTSIGADAFQGATLPDSFTIPSSVTSIGDQAFKDATLPAGFTIPSSVTSIGDYAFHRATLPAGFTIPPTVTNKGFWILDEAHFV